MEEMTLEIYFKDWGMKSPSCRYFTVYRRLEHEDQSVLAMIARALIMQDPFVVWGNGVQLRNWTHVRDIVSRMILTPEKIDDDTAVNLRKAERTRVLDAVPEVLRYAGHKARIELQSEIPTGPKNQVADNSVARGLLGWEPRGMFMDGLRTTIDWYFSTKDRDKARQIVERTLSYRVTKSASAALA